MSNKHVCTKTGIKYCETELSAGINQLVSKLLGYIIKWDVSHLRHRRLGGCSQRADFL